MEKDYNSIERCDSSPPLRMESSRTFSDKNLINERRRNNYQKNKRKIRESRKKYYLKNKKKIEERNKKWQRKNPEKYREIRRVVVMRRIARIHNIIHAFTVNEWIAKKNATQGICPSCSTFVGTDKLTLDHIFPVSKAEEGRIYTIDDVQPLCKSCNSSKNAQPI